jgi:membrane protein required for colicin V production
MIWVDYLIVGLVILSAIIGLGRGLVREFLSLAVWIFGFVIALTFSQSVAHWLAAWVTLPALRLGLAFVILIIAVLIVGGLMGYLFAMLVQYSGLKVLDHLFGFIFGAARGVILVVMVAFLASLTPLTQESWWHQSQLLGPSVNLANDMLSTTPQQWMSTIVGQRL